MQRQPETYGWWRKFVYRTIQTGTVISAWWGHHIRISGQENIPNHANFIAVANHASNWDPPVVSHALGRFSLAFIAKRELFETHPIVSWALESVGCIAIDRDNVGVTSIKSAKNIAAKTDWVVSLFPEGTRQKAPTDTTTDTDDANETNAKRGAAFLAKTIGQPVLPIAVHYSTQKTGWLWPKKTAWVRIGAPIPVAKKADMDELTATIMASIRGLQQQLLLDHPEK